MTEILFYHLTETRMEHALPGLLELSLERDWTCLIRCSSEAMRDHLDQHLWTYRDESFLPHAANGAEPNGNPVWITEIDDDPIGADVCFLVDAAQPTDLSPYQRVVLMFDGHDNDALADARRHWKSLKDQEFDLTYWQQADGRWQKKA